jgi:hypothetical protein
MVLNYNYDIKFKVIDDFNEDVYPIPSDITVTDEYEGLWQAICGELKTWIGEVRCTHLSNYGSRLHELLGENIDDNFFDELNFYVQEVIDNYPEVMEYEIDSIETRGGYYSFNLKVIVDNELISGVVEIG